MKRNRAHERKKNSSPTSRTKIDGDLNARFNLITQTKHKIPSFMVVEFRFQEKMNRSNFLNKNCSAEKWKEKIQNDSE